MKRPLVLSIAAVVALAGSGCSSSGNGASSTLNDAATLSYTLAGSTHVRHISRDQLLSEVRSLVANKPFATYLTQQKFTVSSDSGRTDSRITAIWLSQLIQGQAIEALLASRHVRVTAAERTQAAKDVVQIFPTAEIFPAFSAKFRETLTDRQARSEALLTSYTDTSDAAGEAYFKAHEVQFSCASGKNVAHILVKTQAEAQSVLDQVKAGASFAQLAQRESTDTGSGAQGGALGCLAANQFVAPFQTAAEAAPLGTPVGPVKSQYGYHVILVTKATASYAAARAQVAQALKQQGSQSAAAAINALMKRFKVKVNPRFGTWGPVPNGQGQQIYRVTEPKAPTPASSRESTTTVASAPNGSP